MTDATNIIRSLAQVPQAPDGLPTGWEAAVYDLNILTQVQEWMTHAQTHGPLDGPTYRVSRLLQAGEILGRQAMTGMFKTGILLEESIRIAPLFRLWAQQLSHYQVIRTIEHTGSKTKRTLNLLRRLLKEVGHIDENDDILTVPAVDSFTRIINDEMSPSVYINLDLEFLLQC